MPIGASKYDELCTYVREQTGAEAAIVVIQKGNKGSGFSVQGSVLFNVQLPQLLRHMAGEIELALQGK